MNQTSTLRKAIYSLGALWALAAFLPPPAAAEAPNSLTYQGRLKENGTPVNGTRSIDIRLCDQESGGTCTSTTAQEVSVSSGLFRTTFTVPGSVDLKTGEWYLAVRVGTDDLLPRERLTSSPYAVLASSASTLVPKPGDGDAVLITGSRLILGDGDGASASLILIGNQESSATVKLHNLAAGPIAGDWRMGVDNTGAWSLRGQAGGLDAVRALADGAVGVGTTDPQARLHVSSAGATATDAIFRVSSAAAGGVLSAVGGDGRVGVGTTAPQTTLHVVHPNNVPDIRLEQGFGGTYWEIGGRTGIFLNFAYLGDPKMHIETNGRVSVGAATAFSTMTLRGALGFEGIGEPEGPAFGRGIIYYDQNEDKLKVSENNGSFVNLVDGGGSSKWNDDGLQISPLSLTRLVGVGTTEPGAMLRVSNKASEPYLVVVSTDADGSEPSFTIDSTGEVVVASTLTAGAVDIGVGNDVVHGLEAIQVGSTPDFALRHGYGTTNGNLMYHAFYIGGTMEILRVEKMRVDEEGVIIMSTATVQGDAFSVGGSTLAVTEGKVGIGTGFPLHPLDVAGDLNVQGGIGSYRLSGQTLLSDGGMVGQIRYGDDPGTDFHRFFTGGASRMTIEVDGKVGIGTTEPQTAVHISSDAPSGATLLRISGTANEDVLEVRRDGAIIFNPSSNASTQTAAAMWQFIGSVNASGTGGSVSIPISKRFLRVQIRTSGKDASDTTLVRFNADASGNAKYHYRSSQDGGADGSNSGVDHFALPGTADNEFITFEIVKDGGGDAMVMLHALIAPLGGVPARIELAGAWADAGGITSVDFAAGPGGTPPNFASAEMYVYGHD